MRKFLFRGSLFAVLAYALFAIWIWIDNPIVFGNYFSIQRAKFNRLASIRGKKIVLVGGSNVAFGFDSAKIERVFGVPVVNLGLHASVGLSYQLRSSLPYLKKGDIVLVCPEYEQFHSDQMYGGRELFYVLNNVMPGHWRFLTSRQIFRNLAYVVLEEPKKAEYAWLYWRCPEGEYGQHNSRYNPDGFNEQGDEIWHWRDVKAYSIRNSTMTSARFNPDAADELAWFARSARSCGADVYILPAGLYDLIYNNSQKYIDFLARQLEDRGVPYALSPEKFKMNVSELSDTAYHLNLTGVERRTDMVIEWMRGILPAVSDGDIETLPKTLPTIQNIGHYLECSSGFTNKLGSATTFVWNRSSATGSDEYVRVRIPGLRSRRYRLSLCFRTSRKMYYALVYGNKLEHFPDDDNASKGNEIRIEIQLNETETFVDANGDTVLGLKFPPWKVYPGDEVELTEVKFTPR